MLSTYSIRTEKFHTQKFTLENINFKEKKFHSLDEKIGNREYFNSLSNGMKKLFVREYFEEIPSRYYHTFPFELFMHRKSAYFTGRVRVKFHTKEHKNFEVDLYLSNCWGGYYSRHLKELSPLDFDFYVDLLFEKISYYSKKRITFSMDIDFDLHGKVYEDSTNFGEEIKENLEIGKTQYFIAIYK